METKQKVSHSPITTIGNVVGKNSKYQTVKDSYTNKEYIRLRDDFNRNDYEFLRPDAEIPQNPKLRIIAAQQAYENIGRVRNVIDMMADFVCKGIDLAHKVEYIEKFCKQWWKKINGQDRSERLSNLLYRVGNVITQRSYANLTLNEKTFLQKGQLTNEQVQTSSVPARNKYRIPWNYTIMNPCALEVLGGDIAPLKGRDSIVYGIRLDKTLIDQINSSNYKSGMEQYKVPVPNSLLDYSTENSPNIYWLDKKDTISLFYKKDDWQIWATPMTFPILGDLQVYTKLRLADLVALDGACNYLRIVRLGSLQTPQPLFPAEGALEKMSGILASNSGGGLADIVWGPDVDILESKTDLAQFLNNDKYIPTLNAIYAGLGVPPALTEYGGGQNYNANYITLKTLIERLQYGRNVITAFWENELALLAKSMGFSTPPKLVFEDATISDESVRNKLLIELIDRNIISEKAVQETIGFDPEIEKSRKKRENKLREAGKIPQKVSSLQIPEIQEKMKEIDAKNQLKQAKESLKIKGLPGQGRELGQKDSTKRKKKVVKPRTKAVAKAVAWAKATQKTVSDILTNTYLQAIGKKNLRQITKEQFEDLEDLKFSVLYRCDPKEKITDSYILNIARDKYDYSDIVNLRNSAIEDKNHSTEYIRDLEATICGIKHLSVFSNEGDKNG